jgi:hypothetical protein
MILKGTGTRGGVTRGKYAAVAILFFSSCFSAPGDDPVNTSRTWDREISRIFYARCATCHRQGGTAFSLTTYEGARPWAAAIKEEVPDRKMPPWGAVKGFGSFRNDQTLTQSQLDLIQNWVDGGAPEGDPNDLPSLPKFLPIALIEHRAGEIIVRGDYKFDRPFQLDAFWPDALPSKASMQITVTFPDGRIEPLVWLRGYSAQYAHLFLMGTPLLMPSGAVIHGVPAGSSLVLLPVNPENKNLRSISGTITVPHEKQPIN